MIPGPNSSRQQQLLEQEWDNNSTCSTSADSGAGLPRWIDEEEVELRARKPIEKEHEGHSITSQMQTHAKKLRKLKT